MKDITGALTVQVILNYLNIWEAIAEITLDPLVEDTIRWHWTSDHKFSTASVYQAFFIGETAVQGAKVVHKTRAPRKCKFFVWLSFHGRC